MRQDEGPQDNMESDHSPEAVSARLEHGAQHSYVRDMVYGGTDGAVTTFAVVSGALGADLAASTVVILGLANLFADGFSMAAGDFLGTRAEDQQRDRRRREEEHEIRTIPAGEREEVRQIFAGKGFQGETLEQVVDVITSDERLWVDTMLTEEHGLSLEGPSATRAALSTFGAFLAAGLLPLISFLVNLPFPGAIASPFYWSIGLTAVAFFLIGSLKSRVVDDWWLRSGLETLLLGGVAAALAFGVGMALRGIADGMG
ncbi:MAG: VIT1/CCC1 transporter family protein [Chloroflexota bacterium]